MNKVYSKPGLRWSRIGGRKVSDDQNSCAGSAGSQLVSLGGSGVQIHRDLGVAEKVSTQLKWNSARVVITLSNLASSTIVCSGCRVRMSHPMQPSYCWNGDAGSFWGRVGLFSMSHVRISSITRSDPLSLMRCSCKTKEHQQQHKKTSHKITHTKCKVKVWKRREYVQEEKIKLAIKRGQRANVQWEASTPFTQT